MTVNLRTQAMPGATAWWPDDSSHRIDKVIGSLNDWKVSFEDLRRVHPSGPLYWLYANDGIPIGLPDTMRIVRIDPPPPTAAELATRLAAELARVAELEEEIRALKATIAVLTLPER